MLITVYELLGKIKDGEIPKHIHLLPYSVNKPITGKYTYQDGDYLKDGWKNEWLFKDRLFKHLNDELEIIEEKKKMPEKIDIYEDEEGHYFIDKHCKKIYITCDEVNFMVEEFNQLIDYLKSKGE